MALWSSWRVARGAWRSDDVARMALGVLGVLNRGGGQGPEGGGVGPGRVLGTYSLRPPL